MTIDKAIRLIRAISPNRGTLSEDDFKAIKLGEEALKWVKQWRIDCTSPGAYQLPGETKD